MEEYYSILGLQPGAKPQEIKRAYFSLIRQYSPETDPDKFREIREAYEQLQNPEAQTGPVFGEPADPWAKKMLQQIRLYQKSGQKDRVRDACEEAVRVFPQERQFLYLLAVAQRRAGNTGKAVKTCERLVKEEPENIWFWRELAVAYLERGYIKKAAPAFEKAYALGCREDDFILMYAEQCMRRSEHETAGKIMEEFVNRPKRWSRENLPDMICAYGSLLFVNMKLRQNRFVQLVDELCRLAETYGVYMQEMLSDLAELIKVAYTQEGNGEKEYQAVERLTAVLDKVCHGEDSRETTRQLRQYCLYQRIEKDQRMGREIRRYIGTLLFMEKNDLQKYAILDTKLCMLAKREAQLTQLEALREDYPGLYGRIREFAEQLMSGKNLNYLKTSLLKQYVSMSDWCNGGYYFEEFPGERDSAMGRVVHDWMLDGTYVRETKKIGRNDPCPCGSGKKYKHCCGRN